MAHYNLEFRYDYGVGCWRTGRYNEHQFDVVVMFTVDARIIVYISYTFLKINGV